LLFSEYDLRGTLEAQVAKMLKAIEQYDGNKLLNTPDQDLIDYFAADANVEVPILFEDRADIEQSETKLDMSHDFRYGGGFDDEQVLVPGTAFKLHVPFSGDGNVFRFRSSRYSTMPPRARIEGQELVITHRAVQGENPDTVKQSLHGVLTNVKEYLTWSKNDIDGYNAALKKRATEAVQARKQRLLANQQTAAALGFPLRERAGGPKTYVSPDVRRKIVAMPPAASAASYAPEPVLDQQTYADILTLLSNMVIVMERSPEAFAGMDEESLRTHFLVPLNGVYETATGETFHGSGRTDIRLETKSKSIFIAECKFWDGPSTISETINQLLDYATWRDSKAAILLFSRRGDFSAVTAKIAEAIEKHQNVKGKVESVSETVFRFRLRLRDDSSREMLVTVLAFNVPTKRSVSDRLRPRAKAE
jgi:hypothetical protein